MMWHYVGKCCGVSTSPVQYRYFGEDMINIEAESDQLRVTIDEDPLNIDQDDIDSTIDTSPETIDISDDDVTADIRTLIEGDL